MLTSEQTPITHLAVIMDGNRRWARQRNLPAVMGHYSGAQRVRGLVQACSDRGIKYLTLFAFSTENWQRPATEVSALLSLLGLYLQKEVKDMNAKGVRFQMVGDISRFDRRLQALVHDAQDNTAHNTTITLTIAANYGGRWDMLQAVQKWQLANSGVSVDALTEEALHPYLSTAFAPHPDLLIRTGGDSRISNFMLWQTAYTEFFFSDVLWPAFSENELDTAISTFRSRERRFGGNGPLQAVNA